MKKVAGFTLVELMIVVAIIGILASIALPTYQDYTTRAKMVEAITLASELKSGVIDYYREKDRFPVDNNEAGAPLPEHLIGHYVKSVTVEEGALHVEIGNKMPAVLDGKILILRPLIVTANPTSPVSWLCGGDTPPQGMTPIGQNKTNVPNQFLPASCRQ